VLDSIDAGLRGLPLSDRPKVATRLALIQEQRQLATSGEAREFLDLYERAYRGLFTTPANT